MVVYGFHPVREALRHRPHRVLRVLIGRGRGGARRREIEALCDRHGVTREPAPESRLRELAAGVHNGFVAELAGPAAAAVPPADPELLVLVEDVRDPRNLGALLRACEGAGVGRVLLRDRGTAPLSPAAVRASAGAAEWLAVERITNPARSLGELKDAGFWVWGPDPAGRPPWEVDLTGKLMLCLGGEERGLRARTRGLCDGLVGLPMRGRLESLNVASAAAALLYEAVRQRSG